MSNEKKEDAIDEFTKNANISGLWFYKGRELLISSELLKENSWFRFPIEKKCKILEEDIYKYKHHNASMMLKAMALECYLKGALLHRGFNLFENGKMIGKYQSHKLKDFSNELFLTRSKSRERILDHMQHWIFAGRYPVPKNNKQQYAKHPTDKTPGLQNGLIWVTPMDDDVYMNLLAEINKIFEE